MARDSKVGEPAGAGLAEADTPGRKPLEEGQYLTFRIGSEMYAVPVLDTSEVLGYEESTPVPGTAGWIHGLLNIRGKAIPVIDLATKFGADDREPGDSSCIIVLEVVLDEEQAQVGLVADDMPAVVPLTADQISPPPLFGTLVHARYLRGMARLDIGLVLVLDAVGALTAEDVEQLLALEKQAGAHEEDAGGDAASKDATDESAGDAD